MSFEAGLFTTSSKYSAHLFFYLYCWREIFNYYFLSVQLTDFIAYYFSCGAVKVWGFLQLLLHLLLLLGYQILSSHPYPLSNLFISFYAFVGALSLAVLALLLFMSAFCVLLFYFFLRVLGTICALCSCSLFPKMIHFKCFSQLSAIFHTHFRQQLLQDKLNQRQQLPDLEVYQIAMTSFPALSTN